MAGKIAINPAQASKDLSTVAENLIQFLNAVQALSQDYSASNNAIKSTPISTTLSQATNAMNEMATGVKATVSSYGNAMVQVVNAWVKSQATGASSISYTDPGFSPTTVSVKTASEVECEIGQLDNLMNSTRQQHKAMNSSFETMDRTISGSSSYWIGQSGDQTRNAWNSKVKPLKEKVDNLLNTVVQAVETEKTNILAIDSGNYVQ